ncbi:MAG: 7-cyano-7-deazaguanine synthase QueC [Euryarchaeota archaeon RBG_16_62_10]|nr:MAG: 7-cyano-7-deazaguanine synthase QueC [Euryarchaeota archaeon RBG_16_62_10]
MPVAIVLLSGGLDSSTVLAMAKERGLEVVALTFDYGQKHKRELNSARKVALHFGVREHVIVPLDLGKHLRSALTRESIQIPVGRSREEISSGVPSTYVPSRNIIFLSIAGSIAESVGASTVIIAANAVDFSGYPDCTPEFIEAFQKVLDVGTKAGKEGHGIRVEAPMLRMSKGDIVREAVRLGVPLELTWSCYRGGVRACGRCDSCLLRLRGFAEAGLKDPIEYEVRR